MAKVALLNARKLHYTMPIRLLIDGWMRRELYTTESTPENDGTIRLVTIVVLEDIQVYRPTIYW